MDFQIIKKLDYLQNLYFNKTIVSLENFTIKLKKIKILI